MTQERTCAVERRTSRITQHLQPNMASSATRSPITTHVLDTATGKPAAGMALTLSRKTGESSASGRVEPVWEKVAEYTTNQDGRVGALLQEQLQAGQVYEMHFCTKEYIEAQGKKCFYPFVRVVFEIDDPNAHYHVPLLLSPFGFSTYRGS